MQFTGMKGTFEASFYPFTNTYCRAWIFRSYSFKLGKCGSSKTCQRDEFVTDFGVSALAVVNEFSPNPLAKDTDCSIYVCTI